MSPPHKSSCSSRAYVLLCGIAAFGFIAFFSLPTDGIPRIRNLSAVHHPIFLKSNPWKQLGKTMWGSSGYSQMGKSLAISQGGKRMVSGSPFWGPQSDTGRVQVFELSSVNESSPVDWVILDKPIDGELPGDRLGMSVDMSKMGNWVIAGAPYTSVNKTNSNSTESYVGSAYVYHISKGKIHYKGKIEGDLANENFGYSVGVAENEDGKDPVIVVGCPGIRTPGKEGAVKTFKLEEKKWKLIGEEIVGNPEDELGYSVAISGDGKVIAASSPKTNTVRIYHKNRKEQWKQAGEDIVGKNDEKFGNSVSLSKYGDHVAIGTGEGDCARVYKYSKNKAWKQMGEDIKSGEKYGYSVSLAEDGKSVGVGAPYYQSDHKGQADLYRYVNKKWVSIGRSVTGEQNGAMAGWSVSLSSGGSFLAVGSPDTKDPKTGAIESGSIQVYQD